MEKFAAFFMITFLCGNAVADKFEPVILEDTINATIQELIISNIPDPLEIEDTIDLILSENTVIRGLIEVINPNIKGLRFQVPALNLAVIGMILNFTFLFPAIEINSKYLTDSVVLTNIPVYGNGTSRIVIDGLQLIGSTQFNMSGDVPQLKNFRIQVTLASINVDIHGLFYDEGLSSIATSIINNLANDLIVPYLNDNAEAISDVISPLVQEIINSMLAPPATTPTPETTLPTFTLWTTMPTSTPETSTPTTSSPETTTLPPGTLFKVCVKNRFCVIITEYE